LIAVIVVVVVGGAAFESFSKILLWPAAASSSGACAMPAAEALALLRFRNQTSKAARITRTTTATAPTAMPAFAPAESPLFVDWEPRTDAEFVGPDGPLNGPVLEGRLLLLGRIVVVKPKKSETVTELCTAMAVRVDEITTPAAVDVASAVAANVDPAEGA
jgi:hypothetical protein